MLSVVVALLQGFVDFSCYESYSSSTSLSAAFRSACQCNFSKVELAVLDFIITYVASHLSSDSAIPTLNQKGHRKLPQ
jgi:hypothetical protein